MDLPLLDVRGQALYCQDILTGQIHRWERRSAGAGSKGHRRYDWAMHAVRVKEQDPAAGFAHTPLIRRSKDMKRHKGRPDSYDIEFFLVHAPAGTTLAVMVRTAGVRWRIEEDNKTAKDQLGMDAYQVRKWVGWHRHVTLCMLAQAFLAVTRASQGKRHAAQGGAGDLLNSVVLPLSTAAIRGLLAVTTLLRAVGVTAAIARALWRQVHQTRAMISHYHRRGDPLPLDLGVEYKAGDSSRSPSCARTP